MKITDVTTHLLTSQWKDDPWFPAQLHSTAIIRIRTDSGIDGLGEPTLGYFAPESVPALVDFFKQALVGQDPMNLSKLSREMFDQAVFWARSGAGRSVIGGIELALWDIMGKALNVPVYQLLGGAVRDRVPVYASGGPAAWPIEDNIKKIDFYTDEGYRAVKFSTHFYESVEPTDTSGCVRLTEIDMPFAEFIDKISSNLDMLRREFGGSVDLAVDGHQGGVPNPIPVTEAIEIANAVAPFRLRFFEEPLAYTDLEGYVALRAQSRVPIAGGESFSGLDQFNALICRNGLHVIQPDIGFVGGLQETVRIIHLSEAVNVSTALHTGAAVGPAWAAAWHLAAATRSVEWLEHLLAARPEQNDLLLDRFEVRDGFAGIPSAPGLGVQLTDDQLSKYRFIPGSGQRT